MAEDKVAQQIQRGTEMAGKDYGFDGDTSTTPSGKYFDSPSSTFTYTIGEVGTDLSNYILWVNGEQYRLLSIISDTRVELADTAVRVLDLRWMTWSRGQTG